MITRSTGLEEVLKKHHFSTTKSRQLIFALFTQNESLSMAELIKRLQGKVNRASVYRVVELFERLDIIHRLQSGWKYKYELSDMFREHHHHAICIHCGADFSVREDDKIEKDIVTLGNSINFQVTDHTLEIRGFCTDCKSDVNML